MFNVSHAGRMTVGGDANGRIDKLSQFAPIYNKLLPVGSALRHIPVRVYLPFSTGKTVGSSPNPSTSPKMPGSPVPKTQSGHLRVVQSLVQPLLSSTREPQTLGTALNAMLPALFPSRRRMILARPVLHGAVVPLEAVMDDLMRGAVYADGWLNFGIDMVI